MKRPPVILRLLVPLAVAGMAVVVLLVVASSIPDSDSDDDRRRGGRGDQQSKQQPKTDEKFYTVEPGDTLTTIADKTGIGVDKLTELNPDLDPQALISGEQVKLRK
jgi:LysM repeat protein